MQGADKEKVMRLQTHKIQLELIPMEENETINDFTMIITRLVNQVTVCGEIITEQCVVVKILRSLMPRFDNVVVVIEESKDHAPMRKKELQSSLEAHEQRIKERNVDKIRTKIDLQVCFKERDNKTKGK